jgi:hypothetical protein
MMKYFGTILLLVCMSTLASAQHLFNEDFTGAIGTALTSAGWTQSGTTATNPLKITSASAITFTGYAGSGVGNAALIDTTGQDDYKTFTADSIGSVYLAFMFNVTKAATGDYFVAMSPSSSQTNYYARTFIKSSGSGFVVGISKSNETASYGTTVFSLNTTYIAVVKYTFVAADSDIINVMIIPSSASITAEPSTAEISGYQDKTKNDATNLGSVTIRQGGSSSAPRIIIDGIRIGSSWNDVFYSSFLPPKSIAFGQVNVSSSAIDSFYVKNSGASSLSIASVTSSDPVFAVVPTSSTIAAADSQYFVVTYTPTSVVSTNGTILVAPTGSTSPDTVFLSGSGVQAGFSGTPTNISFGNVFKDSTETDTVTVTNASTSASLVIDSVRSSNSLFTVTPGNATITTSSSAKFAVAFMPTAKGAATANIIFYHNAPSHQDTVKVNGNGILIEPLFTATPSSIDFGAVLLTKSKMDSIVVKNTGYDSLIISSAATGDAAFVVTPSTARLDTMVSQKFYVTFTAGAAGYKSGSIVFVNNTSETKDTVLLKANVLTTVPISEARKDLNNDYVADHSITHDTLVISGVITSPNMGASASQMSYFMQDATGGLDLWVYGLSTLEFARGDSVMVTGTVAQYKGVVEFTPLAWDNTYIKLLSHVSVPAPKRVTLHQFVTNPESYEGQLIEIDTVYKATGTWPTTPANVSLYVTNASKTDTVQLFIDFDSNIGGTEPAYPINVVGIMSQYSSSTPPNNGYEISPRDSADIVHTPGTAGVDNQFSGVPKNFELFNSYPNPFNPSTTISYGLPQQSKVTLRVYSVLGQEIATLVDDVQGASYHKIQWNGKDDNGTQVSSGVYFFRIVAQPVDGKSQTFTQVRKMMLMK